MKSTDKKLSIQIFKLCGFQDPKISCIPTSRTFSNVAEPNRRNYSHCMGNSNISEFVLVIGGCDISWTGKTICFKGNIETH